METTMKLTTTITSIMAPTAGPDLAITTAGAHSSVATTAVNSLEATECNQAKASTPDVVAKASTEARATEDVEAKAPTQGMVVKSGTEAKAHKWDVEAKGSTERAALAGLAQWEAGAPIAVAALAALTEPEAGPLMAEVAAVTAESSLDESRWTLRVNWRNLAPFNKATYVEKRNSFDQRTCFVIRDIAVPT